MDDLAKILLYNLIFFPLKCLAESFVNSDYFVNLIKFCVQGVQFLSHSQTL